MVRLLRKLHRYLYLASVLFFFTLFYPVLWILAQDPERHFNRIARCRRIIGVLSSAMVGIFYRFRYETAVDWSKPHIICANHTSNLDITALVLLCPTGFSFMGKMELLNNPVTGMFFRTIDIPLKRDSKISAFRAFQRALVHIKQGKSMAIFPEGHIGEEFPPRLYSFKNGPFKLAIEAQVPIIPVVIQNAWRLHWDEARQFGSRPGIVRVEVLAPVVLNNSDPAGADHLRDEVYNRIREQWNRIGGL
ncbi:lysophospholipid acyltransferase family protein [Parapedobacter lycopersici]|uniref:lysophospholipid acyltransferase family protein n=1 Tax=Parapedobacter lycopersici TaxID=1864939 RepID=UPI00333FE724